MCKFSAEELSRAGDKYLGTPYSEMDCQEFVERCMADVGYDRNLAGSNAWFRAMSWTGTPEECVTEFGEVPNGALLFVLEQDGKEPEKYKDDGIGNASHVGLVTHRNDGAIHSSSSRGCVATSKFKDKTIPNGGWNRVGLLDAFTYTKTIDWVLAHGNSRPATEPDGGESVMRGIVVAENGGTVKLRQKPSTSCPYYEDIPVGTPVTILESGSTWSRITTGRLTGWMKNEFIRAEEDPAVPDPGEDDFVPGDLDDDTVEIRLTLTRAEAQLLLKIADNLGWQLSQTTGGVG